LQLFTAIRDREYGGKTMSTTAKLSLYLVFATGLATLSPLGAVLGAAEQKAADVAVKKPTAQERQEALEQDVTQGALRVVKEDGSVVECPLRHTDVKAEVSGFIARVKVTQTFYNPTNEKVEAVYVFPLPHESAVDDMTMVIGERKIVGLIKRRDEARRIYEQALLAGQTAALLEQERPNIFTQSVGNIDPGQEVNIEIGYVDVLNYDMGTYEFHFPMVVGPRFIPGAPIGSPPATSPELRGKVSPPVPDTTRVPDASRISPPVLKPGMRNGHDVSLAVRLDAGVPIQGLTVPNHDAKIDREGDRRAEVTLSPADSIPNKDFVLRYFVVGKKPEMAVLSHTGEYTDGKRLGEGYFMLMVQPKEDERLTKSPPREIVFLLDVSGSMSGKPTEKVKEAMRDMLALCRPIDTMQVITFAGSARQLFDKPLPVEPGNVKKALRFTEGYRAGGGTYMLQGVKKAIDQPIDEKRVRIVIMLTDGYIGNEAEIIQHVGRHCGDQIRFWAIGIGSSPNMFLIDGVARQGGGMGKKLGLNDKAAGLAEEVITRIQRAQLAKIRIDWGSLNVAETYPAEIPELWAGRPVILFGRYAGGGQAAIKFNGVVEGQEVSWPLQVALPEKQPAHDVLAKVWARKKIEDLMQQTYYMGSPPVEEEVTAIALDYRLMSQYTSFVAVDEKEAEKTRGHYKAQPPRRMMVPVPLPEGTQWEGFFGPLGEGKGVLGLALERQSLKKAEKLSERLRGRRHAQGFGGGMGGMGGMGRGVLPSSGRTPARRPSPARPGAKGYGVYKAPHQLAGPVPVAGNQLKNAFRYSFEPGSRRDASVARDPGRFGAVAGKPISSLTEAAARELHEDFDGEALMRADYTAIALASGAQELVKPAEQLLDSGRKHVEKGATIQGRANLVRAYFLAAAAANRGNRQAGQIAGRALAELESLHVARVNQFKKDLPALDAKLDLVLRDVSIGEALDRIAQAAGLKIRLITGSVEDAREMLSGRAPRVTYLDLRGTTTAQALDWLLQPVRLSWRIEPAGGKVVLVGSDRRLPQVAAWVYDVSIAALPDAKEFEKIKKREDAVAKARRHAEQFLGAMRKKLNASDKAVTWFAPGHLLVIGSPRHHQQAASEIMRWQTGTRVKARREQVERIRTLSQLMETAAVHEQFGWKLLAAALGGGLDLEALTELQVAWKAEETTRLLEGKGGGVVLRSAWAITAAARLIPEKRELAALATAVRGRSHKAAQKAAAAVKETPDEQAAVLTAVYGTLATGDAKIWQAVLATLPKDVAHDAPNRAAVTLGRALLVDTNKIDGEALAQLISTDQVVGEDLTVLAALACRRAGADTWSAFRRRMQELLGEQPLSGGVVVLISRLSGNVGVM